MKKLLLVFTSMALLAIFSLPLSAQDGSGVEHSHTDLASGGCVDIYTYPDGRVKTVTTAPCTYCSQTGVCQYCRGAGQTFVAAGMYSRYIPCLLCSMTGRCRLCGGAGAVSYSSWGYSGTGASGTGGSYGYGGSSSLGGSVGIGDGGSYSSSSGSSRRQCSSCNGTGKGWSEIVYAPNYTGKDNSRYCSECGSVSPAHTHIHHRCSVCSGKGYVEY